MNNFKHIDLENPEVMMQLESHFERHCYTRMEQGREYLYCPYCNGKAYLQSNSVIYNGKEYGIGFAFICENYPTCDAYVGTYDDGKPLGRLADRQLRLLKREVHAEFDELWKESPMSRKTAYGILGKLLNLYEGYTHIGFFTPNVCREALKRLSVWKENHPSKEPNYYQF